MCCINRAPFVSLLSMTGRSGLYEGHQLLQRIIYSCVVMQVALGLYIISKIGRLFTVVGWLYTGA